jgi:hypothetical protein
MKSGWCLWNRGGIVASVVQRADGWYVLPNTATHKPSRIPRETATMAARSCRWLGGKAAEAILYAQEGRPL